MTGHDGRAAACWAAAEPFTLGGYLGAEASAAVEEAGVPRRVAFFVLRAAPLGAAAPSVVAAVFRSFPLATIEAVLTQAWQATTPQAAVELVHRSVPVQVARVAPGLLDDPRVPRAAEALGAVVRELDTGGRPLAAANQAVPPPADPWARLWRASNTLREYRGDAHVAVLTAAGLGRVEADVLTSAWAGSRMDTPRLQSSRQIDGATWDTAVADLATQGLLTPDGAITADGRRLRDDVEAATDRTSVAPWAALTEPVLQEVWELFCEVSAALIDAHDISGTTPVGAPWPPPRPLTA